MNVFYGYNRDAKSIPDTMGQVFIDDATTSRQERNDMLSHGLRPGDVLHVFALSDLGQGAEAKAVLDSLAANGFTPVLVETETPPETRGRPAMFRPKPEQDDKCKTLYRSYLQMSYVLDRVEQIMGARFQAHHLKARYGRRWKEQKEGD